MERLKAFFLNRKTVLLLVAAVVVVYGLSYYQRQATYSHWMENPETYVVEDVTAMTSKDAYFWLKMARELDEGNVGVGKVDSTKGYPDMLPLAIKDKPGLLAEMISLAKNFTGGDYYRAGLLLVPVLAGLFIFPLFFYFHKIGFGAAAILGGLIGTFSKAYFNRTAMGRVDTDLLNTFFPLTAACFLLPMSREKSWRANLGLAVGAGLTLYLFTRWYQQPSFILVFGVFMLLYLLFQRLPWKQVAVIVPVFLLASGPEYVLQIFESVRIFVWAYFFPRPTGDIAWPGVLKVVAEAQERGIGFTLKKLHGFMPLVVTGFTGLLYLYIRHFRRMIPVTPMVLLGAWSLVGPTRFAMYMAPFVGIGTGVLVELAIRQVAKRKNIRRFPATAVSIALMFVIFFSTSAHTGYSRHPAPALTAETTKALLEIKRRVPRNSAMFSPVWGISYELMQIGDFATYHDGGLQGGIRTTLVSKAMTSHRQGEMVSLLSYLEDHGFGGLKSRIRKEKLSGDQMMETVFDYPGPFRGENVYVLYLEDMIDNMDSISYFGTWDFDERKSNRMYYFDINCFSVKNNVMRCRDGIVDMDRGVMNEGQNDVPLRGILWVNNGYVTDSRFYDHEGGYYLQIMMVDDKVQRFLVADERLFRTNFNQQFILGNYDRRYFEEVYNDFPVARVLKVKNGAPQSSAPRERTGGG